MQGILVHLLVCCLLSAVCASAVLGQKGGGGTPPPGPGPLPAAFPGDPGYPLVPGSPIILLPGDPGYPAYPGAPIIIFPPGSGDPIYIWPDDPDYPGWPGDPIIIWPGDPNYPWPPFQSGDPITVNPGDPGYPLFPIAPGDPIYIPPGAPGYPADPSDPSTPPIFVHPGDPGYPGHSGDPITVSPGDPGYPGGPGSGSPGGPGAPGGPGYGGDPMSPGNGVLNPPGPPAPDGHNPYAGVALASDGNLYGVSTGGGTQGHGIVFRMDTSGHNYTILHTFTGADGADPAGELIVSDGWLYGTTRQGGANNSGVLFRIDITGTRSGIGVGGGEAHWLYTPLHHFWTFTGCTPYSGLVLGQDGCLYGTTFTGGPNDTQHTGVGVVFKFDLNSHAYTVLHTFQATGWSCPDGVHPNSLVQGADGTLYGTTQQSAASQTSRKGGTVFKIRPDGSSFQTLHVFQSDGARTDGADSEARLLIGSNGYLYGTTVRGGVVGNDPNTVGFGTIFKLSTSGQGYTQLHVFARQSGDLDGIYPESALIQGSDGNLYGTTRAGGASGEGTVYRIGLSGSGYQVLYSFSDSATTGMLPYAPVIQGADGSLYGATYSGATQGFGAVYKLTPGNTAYALHQLGTPTDNPDDQSGTTTSTVHLLSLNVSPTTVTGGTNSTGTIMLDAPAPPQGAVVTLSSDSTAASVFRSVVFAAGQTTATFTVTTHAVATSTTANITATYNGSSLSAALTILPPTLINFTLNPQKVTGGANATGILGLSGPAPDGGLVVSLSSSQASTVTVPSSVLIAGGAKGTSFLAATNSVMASTSSVITATLGSVAKQATLTVMPGYVSNGGLLADATVISGANANTNYGQQPWLLTEADASSNTNTNAVTYLKFDLSNVLIAPTSATLKLTVNGNSVPQTGLIKVRVYGVSDTTWTEQGITWANAPGLDRGGVTGTGTLLTTQEVPLNGGVAAFDVTPWVVGHLRGPITLQIVGDAHNGLCLGTNSKEAASGHPELVLTSSFLNDVPAPIWALNVIPTDGSPSGGGPSSSDSVNLASGVEENTPGPDIAGRNVVGPSAVFSRLYRSVTAANGYASPGLSPGWTHNYDIRVQGAQGAWTSLTLLYPNGAKEQWTPLLDANYNPTGILNPTNPGIPYFVQGVPSPTTTGRWLTLSITWKDRTSWTFTPAPNAQDSYLLTRISNPLGRSLYLVYDGNGLLMKATDDSNPSRTLLNFQYNGGYLASVTETYGRTVNYTFGQTDGGVCLTGVSQLNSAALEWQYDYTGVNGWPMLSSVGAPDPTVAPGGAIPIRTHPITYYPDGRVATMEDANGNKRLYTYAGGTQVQVYSPGGALVDQWTQMSGSLNNQTGSTDANNKADNIAYTDLSNPYRPTQYTSKDPAHPQIVSATYDSYGNTLTSTANGNGATTTTTFQYDYTNFVLGTLTTAWTTGGAQTSYTYYPNGLVHTVTGTAPGFGMANPTVTYYYTALGNISTVTAPGPNSTGQLVSTTYNYVYDPLDGTQSAEVLGQPLTVTSPSGAVTHFRYDARGNRVAVIDALGNRTDFVYNQADQLVSTIAPATGQTGPGRAHVDITYQYVGGPAVATVAYDESNMVVRQAAQTSGKEGEAVAQTGNVEQASYGYDAQQRLTSLKDGNNHAFSQSYDLVGNMTQLTYPGGAAVHGQYSPDGVMTQFTNARGQSTTTTLIPNDPGLQSVLHSDGRNEQFSYDWLGRTSQITDGSTTLAYTYDTLGDVMSVTTTYAGLPIDPATTSYGYNSDGTRAFMSQPWGSASYVYDVDGRLTDVNYNWQNGLYHYDYDKLGRLIHKQTAQTETTYQYNAVGQLIGLTNYDGNHTPVSDFNNFHYDGAGNLLQMSVTTATWNGNASGTVTYTYDAQDRLTRELSQRNAVVPGNNADLLGFDNLSASDAADNLTLLRGVAFTPNLDNQIASDSLGSPYAYDLDGNPTTQESASLQYDDAGHVIDYLDNLTGMHLQMGYRPDGLRAWKQVNGGSRVYSFYDGEQLTAEIGVPQNGVNPLVRLFGWGAAGLEQTDCSRPGGSSQYFYLFDPQGNLAHRVVQGVAVDLACYDAFGKQVGDLSLLNPGGQPYNYGDDPIGWGGQWGAYTDLQSGRVGGNGATQAVAGLILLTHRYYNPDTGRFLTRDPIGYEGGINVYAYCRNNPVMGKDPSGLTEVWDLFFVAWDVYNIAADYVTHAPPAVLALDETAFAIDGALALIPGAPAGPGNRAIAGVKATLQTVRAVDRTTRAAQGIYHTASTGAKLVNFASSKSNAEEGNLPKGGTYKLIDEETQQVVRTGRANDLARRKREHARDPDLKKYKFEIDKRTDSYAAQRGREQILHDTHKPPLNKVGGIDPRNPRRDHYIAEGAKL